MDNKKILIVNLSKGRLGEDNSSLLGGMLITKIQLAAMERVDQPESERKDFFLYVDEFQNFATPSFANILSEARKYRLGLIMAHQYIAQLDEVVADAVFGNVGTIVSFRVGSADAEVLAKEFTPQFIEEDIVNLLNKYYFFAGKVCQLYNGNVSYCAEGEVIVDFTSIKLEDEQSFYSICAAQLFLQLVGDLRDIGGKHIPCNFKLAVHSGQTVSGLYSPITQESNGLMGKTLDLTRQICDECPDNSLLISDTSFEHAGAGTRVTAEEFSIVDDEDQVITYLSDEPMSGFRFLLERQAIQLVTLYTGT